jgi:hypothetical protein
MAPSRAARAHPDPLIYHALGTQLGGQRRWAEAEAAFLLAAHRPSWLPIRRAALLGAIQCQWAQAVGLPSPPEAEPRQRLLQARGQLGPALAAAPLGPLHLLPAVYLAPVPPGRRALDNVRTLAAWGGIRPDQAYYLAHVAIEMNELDLARGIIADWERQAPQDLQALRKRVTVELKAGACGRAVRAADQLLAAADAVLARKPGDKAALASRQQALKLRNEAIRQLRNQADSLAPADKP